MAKSLYVTSSVRESGKSAIALALYDSLLRRRSKVGLFRPLVAQSATPDPLIALLQSLGGMQADPADLVGVTYAEMHADPDAALATIIARHRAVAARSDVVLVIGSDFSDVGSATEFAYNARIAANLGAPMLYVLNAQGRDPEDLAVGLEMTRNQVGAEHAELICLVVNKCTDDQMEPVREALTDAAVPVYVVPDLPYLAAPSIGEIMRALDGTLLAGTPESLQREVLDSVVAAMTLPNALNHFREQSLVITPGDRADVILGAIAAHRHADFPALAGIVLTGGFTPAPAIKRLMAGDATPLPMIATKAGTFKTASTVANVRGAITPKSGRKIDLAKRTIQEHADMDAILDSLRVKVSSAVTPLMFEYQLIDAARRNRRTIVLPEGAEPRILQAADIVLRRGIADIILLGDAVRIRRVASSLGVDVSKARIVSPEDPDLRERFAVEYARLRAHKGVTVDSARDWVVDVSYFGTLMVHLGLADGMVSGAVHSTAHTIRPSFEIIKTKPGAKIVSSVFIMCLADRVLVYGDCAVNPNPTAEQLADIAIQSAETALAFGIAPRVAMLSYSTGTSGSGADVDRVRTATELVRAARPDLSVEGPIQYDAAVDLGVARTKLPDSKVAGRATVFVFPDLNTGNNTYKAVQRSANAVAIGPVLQGLNKPVNDLSRGALVEDIVNTIAITAVQAGHAASAAAAAAEAASS